MNERQLMGAFEGNTLTKGQFRHVEHVRLVWAYLRELAVPETMIVLRDGLRRIALRFGAPDLYHETITFAYVGIIAERMGRESPDHDWAEFRLNNGDLLEQGLTVLKSYYREETLFSERAKKNFLLPDRPLNSLDRVG